jgi:hypothetical protein
VVYVKKGRVHQPRDPARYRLGATGQLSITKLEAGDDFDLHLLDHMVRQEGAVLGTIDGYQSLGDGCRRASSHNGRFGG